MNHEAAISELLSAPSMARERPPEPPARASRISPVELADLITRYEAGESTHELAAGTAAHRHTIARALRNAGVGLRDNRRRLTEEQVSRATARYRDGWTLAQLADEYGVGRETVRRELISAGVVLRPRGGRR